ncbi:MAG: hypothetical protein LBU19_10225 [Treponema sp.]|jgi:hypothetical protein|nr:hypothetical protein [Treponema sp.]
MAVRKEFTMGEEFAGLDFHSMPPTAIAAGRTLSPAAPATKAGRIEHTPILL